MPVLIDPRVPNHSSFSQTGIHLALGDHLIPFPAGGWVRHQDFPLLKSLTNQYPGVF